MLHAAPIVEELREISGILTPEQMALFCRMQPSEQAHSLQVYHALRSRGTTYPEDPPHDLLVAALLHDVGKTRSPLQVWERVWVVLAQGFFPGQVERWGRGGDVHGKIPWWQRPLVVAVQHPLWGAELAEEVGASPLAVRLIRQHQDDSSSKVSTVEERYLQALQAVDGNH